MERLKVKVSSEAESREAQDLFFELGYSNKAKFTKQDFIRFNGWICALDDGSCDYSPISETDRKITLQELRDMVVLKRNDVGDANYTCDREKKYYVTGDDVYMYVVQGEWSLCKNLPLEKAIEVWGLKPIKGDVMKESLNDKIVTAEVARQDVLKPEDFGAVDNVNHPSHYASGGIECIDAMIAAYGVEAVKAYCKCNAFKYQWRFDKKNGNEDILKAQWYQNKYMELSNEI